LLLVTDKLFSDLDWYMSAWFKFKLVTDEVADNGTEGGEVTTLSLDAKTGGGVSDS
jgi:hypothetical protein